MDYTVIVNVRAHFGNEPGSLPGDFVGKAYCWDFECPNIDPTQTAVLMFQSLQVTTPKNIFIINDKKIYGGLPTTTQDTNAWTGNVLLVSPGTLDERGNALCVQALDSGGGVFGDIDDFVIDNVVLFYKTVGARRAIGAGEDVSPPIAEVPS